MTASELVTKFLAGFEDSNVSDPVEQLVRKLARAATSSGVAASDLDVSEDDRFTDDDRKLYSTAVAERSDRHQQELAIEAEQREKNKRVGKLAILPKRADGWWLDNRDQGDPSNDEIGPYETKAEAQDARASILRSRALKDSEISSEPRSLPAVRSKALKKAAETINLSAAEDVSEPVAREAKKKRAKSPESEAVVRIEKPKAKAKAKPHKAEHKKAEHKPKKPPVAKANKMHLSDAAAHVLKGRSVPMTVAEIAAAISKKGLWSSKAPTPVATLSAKLYLEIARKGPQARFKKVGPGQFLHS